MSGQFDNAENNEPFALLESVKRSALQLRLLIEPQQTLRELLVKSLAGWRRFRILFKLLMGLWIITIHLSYISASARLLRCSGPLTL